MPQIRTRSPQKETRKGFKG
jgi:hypothetical protein